MSLKSRSGSVAQLFAPLKTATQRFTFTVLVVLSVLALLVGRADPLALQKTRLWVADVAAPVLSFIHQPVAAVTSVVTDVQDVVNLYQENRRLRADNATLLEWQRVAQSLNAENQALRALTHYRPPNTNWFVTARVIGAAGGVFSRNLLVDRGSADGVAPGQGVLTGTGLIGRIAEVGSHTSRVLLMTDLNSRIPVSIEPEHTRAILAGDNSDQLQLSYLPPHTEVRPGDRIVTSGDGGVFPPGIPVGSVVAGPGDTLAVQPYTDLSRVDYLRIADFGLSGVLPPSAAPLPKPVKAKHGAARKSAAREANPRDTGRGHTSGHD
ncbi:MAG TPA: rod shape-determining protein MreC [Stellaceae bacterium]|nr:rod shape-determining protein MreC [Stellaceae bacterium]